MTLRARVTRGVRGARSLRYAAAVVLALAFCLLLDSSSSWPAPDGPTWTATSSPFKLAFTRGATTVAEADGIEYASADGADHSLGELEGSAPVRGGTSYRLAAGDGHTATVVVRSDSLGLHVAVTITPAAGIAQLTDTFATLPTEHFLGAGEQGSRVDLRGSSAAVKVSYGCDELAVPFFLSSRGYGIDVESSRVGAIGFPGSSTQACADPGDAPCELSPGGERLQLCLKGNSLDYQVFFGSPQQVVRDHAAVVGKPRLPPSSELGLIKWRDVGNAQTAVTDVKKFHALGIPIGWELIDDPWEDDDCIGRLQFGPPRFPNGANTVRALHALGVDVMLWISPLVQGGQACLPLPYASGALLGPPTQDRTIDLRIPSARAELVAKLEKLFSLGIDGFKVDRGDDVDLEKDGATLSNDYPVLFQRAIVAAARAAGHDSFAEMVRAASSASPSLVAGVWAGDQDASWQGLATAVGDAQGAGVSGFPIWGSDVGGYASAKLFDELFVRWAQFGALSPIMEVGGQGLNATPWVFAASTVDLFRDAVLLHYALAPYLLTLERQSAATGDPILRALGYEYPQESGAWANPGELLVGNDLLAEPVDIGGFGTMAAPNPQKIGVFLPAGTWYDLYSGGAPVTGPTTILRLTTLADFPLYAKAGAIVPLDLRIPGVWSVPWSTNAISTAGRAGWLYAPGSQTAKLDLAGRGDLVASTEGNRVTLRLASELPQTQIFIPATVLSVDVGGKRLAESAVPSLSRVGAGWSPVSTPFPGTVVKLGPSQYGKNVSISLESG